MRKSWTPLIVVPIIIILAFIIGRLGYYGFGASASYTPPERPLTDVPIEVAAVSNRLEAVDNPTVSEGVVVIDYAHDNALFIEELNTLLAKIVSRGFSYEVVLDPEVATNDEEADFLGKLRYAKSLILPLPRREYTPEEITEIERFVERGGRVFLIGDPTRTVVVEALNSIAGSFGLIYVNDYLYSLTHNDNNYRNVIYTDFQESPVTEGLDDNSKIILYASGSIQAPGYEIILGDETTFSSTSEGGRGTAAAALTTQDQVLAIGDLTFFSEPYSAAENNGVLINNIADFLAAGQPTYNITDFPYFFNGNIDIVFDDPLVFNSQFEDATALKDFLENTERTVNFADAIGDENDTIFVSRYDKDLSAIEEYLAEAQITILEPDQTPEEEEALALTEEEALTEEGENSAFVSQISDTPPDDEERFIDGRIRIKGIGELERGGSTLFYLHQEDNRNILIILSDTPTTSADAFDLLLDNELIDCQASSRIAVCQTDDPAERLPPSLRSNRISKILIVSDDEGRVREDELTGALEFTEALSGTTYNTDTWVISEDGQVELDNLLDYDAIIWTTGDYWDDSVNQHDVELLTEYVKLGGNLILSGASIAFDWDHTEFLQTVVHADYLNMAEQQDLEVALPEHPIAADFDAGAVITFTDTPSGEALLVDVVTHTPDARVIFSRGSESDEPGAPSIIAYEDERVKIAYFAFPAYLLPDESLALLVNNTIDWFTVKPLDLPDEDDYEPYESQGTTSDETAEDSEETPPEEGTDETSGGEDSGENGQGNGEEGENGNNQEEENSNNNEEGNEGAN